jgi:hypothetical protein
LLKIITEKARYSADDHRQRVTAEGLRPRGVTRAGEHAGSGWLIGPNPRHSSKRLYRAKRGDIDYGSK